MNTCDNSSKKKETNIRKIDEIIERNKDVIMKVIIDSQIEHASYGLFNRNDYISILFDLEDEKVYKHIDGQGLSQDLYEKSLDRKLISVFRFQSGQLSETAKESVLLDFEDEDIKYDIAIFNSEVKKRIIEMANIYGQIDIDYNEISN